MKDFKTYLKDKLKKQVNIVGKAELLPPPVTEVLQSSSALSVLDLISEGPIEGLVTKDGKYAKGLRLFESFYLNNTPVKQQEILNPITKNLPFSKVKDIDRLTTGSVSRMLENIKSRLSGVKTSVETGSYLDIFHEGVFYRMTETTTETTTTAPASTNTKKVDDVNTAFDELFNS